MLTKKQKKILNDLRRQFENQNRANAQVKKKKPTKKKPIVTLVNFILDKSSSMHNQVGAAISGHNEHLDTLRNDGGDIRYTLTTFDSTYNIIHKAVPVNDVPHLTDKTYVPNGMTALYDAVGRTIHAVDEELNLPEYKGKNVRTMFVILTDGQENSSREYTMDHIRSLIQEREKRGNWSFVFLGADATAWDVGRNFGISLDNVIQYDFNNMGQTFDAVARSSASYLSSDSLRTKSFSTANKSVMNAYSKAGATIATDLISGDPVVTINNDDSEDSTDTLYVDTDNKKKLQKESSQQ